uniref:MRG domain-containing protein n=2 Tax=Panagrolaimus sp. JU765 TaxID=591449 RepID=A0AC34QJB0_9BILA
RKGSDFIASSILDNILVDDYDIITRQAKIPVVPARYSVKQICGDYISYLEQKLEEENPENLKMEMEFIRKTESEINTLLRFFNRIICLRLMYKIEAVQYRYFRAAYKNMPQIILPDVESVAGSSTTDDPNKFIDVVTTDVVSLPSQTDIVENNYHEGERRSARVRKLEKQKAANEKKKAEKAKAEQQIYDLENYFDCTHMYGFIHLVRFLHFLAELMTGRKHFPESVIKRTSLINDLILYLTENAENYFDINVDYENPEPTVLRDVLR